MTEAVGHAVRAGYIYSAMADAARHFGDSEYEAACKRVFENITNRKMYVTGGMGSTNNGEAFTVDYDLPNDTGYAETCAAISLAYFARRMLLLKPDRRYADVAERVIYNGALCGVSLDGDKFFYSNTLEIDPRVCVEGIRPYYPALERAKEFWCSCCPPNILRFIASITEGFYTYNDDVLFIHQFAESEANVRGATVIQKTSYPCDGVISLSIRGDFKTAAIRIPGWCETFTFNAPYTLLDGYAYIDIPSDGEIKINFDMPVRLVEANPAVACDVGKAAVTRGPLVYCLEGKDNGGALYSLFLKEDSKFAMTDNDEYGVPVLVTEGLRRLSSDALYSTLNYRFEPSKLTFIPYFAYANRGADEMTVWVRTLPGVLEI